MIPFLTCWIFGHVWKVATRIEVDLEQRTKTTHFQRLKFCERCGKPLNWDAIDKGQ